MSYVTYKLHRRRPRMLLFVDFVFSFNQEWKCFPLLKRKMGCELSFLEMSHGPGIGEES